MNYNTTDSGSQSEAASANLNINNFNVREALTIAERAAAKSADPGATFTKALGDKMFGDEGLRSKYLDQAADRRSTVDLTSPIASMEKSSVLSKGGFKADLGGMLGGW